MTVGRSVQSSASTHTPQPPRGNWNAWLDWAQHSAVTPALGMTISEIGDGMAAAVIEESIVPLNPNGSVHGGLVAAFVDQIGSLATATRLSEGYGLSTCTLNFEYMRPAMLPLVAVGRVVRTTRSLLFTHVEVRTGADVAVSASGTWLPKRYPPDMS